MNSSTNVFSHHQLRRNAGGSIVQYQAVHALSTEEVAVKIVNVRELHPADEIALMDEISVLQELVGCSYIVELLEVFQEPQHTFLVTERMRGGTLMQSILSKSRYTEQNAKIVCRNLLLGLQYCHSKRIANRNIQPESIMLVSKDNNVDVKIADFCLAKKVIFPNSLRTQCGTEGYMAPEILQHQPEYDVQVRIRIE